MRISHLNCEYGLVGVETIQCIQKPTFNSFLNVPHVPAVLRISLKSLLL